MEFRFLRIIKAFIYLSLITSFLSGFVLLFIKFENGKTLLEIHSSKVIFPLFVPFLIGLVCLYSSRRKNVSTYYIPITLFIGSIFAITIVWIFCSNILSRVSCVISEPDIKKTTMY